MFKKQIFIFITVIFIFSCKEFKRKKSDILLVATNEKNGAPIEGVVVNLWRKGKETFFTKKEPLLLESSTTNSYGEIYYNFKFERGNQYGADFHKENYTSVNQSQTYDLEIGDNKFEVKLRELNYLKVRAISGNTFNKNLTITCGIETVSHIYHYYIGSTIDTNVFGRLANLPGSTELKWSVDSSGTLKNYSSTINLNGHDTAYFTINY